MGMGKGLSDSGDSTEMHQQEECRRAAAERTGHLKKSFAMTGKGHWLVDAEARAILLGKVGPSDLDKFPWGIHIHLTVTGYSESSFWKGPLLVSTSPVWLQGSKGSQTLIDHQTFRAKDLGLVHGALTTDHAKEDNGLY